MRDKTKAPKPKPGPNATLPNAVHSKISWLDHDKAGGAIFTRSGIESDVMASLLAASDVAWVERNDLTSIERLTFKVGRKPARNREFLLETGERHEPDLTAGMTDGTIVYVQCGTKKAKTKTEMRRILEEVRRLAREEGADFLVATEYVRRGQHLHNVRKLGKHRKPILDQTEDVERWRAAVAAAREIFERAQAAPMTVPQVAESVRATIQGLSIADAESCAFASCYEALAEDRLVFDLDHERIDLGSALAMTADGSPARARGWLARALAAQLDDDAETPELDTTAMLLDQVDPTAEAEDVLSAQELAAIDQRTKMVAYRETHLGDDWETVGEQNQMSASQARYWWKKFRAGGEAALTTRRTRPGVRVDDGLKAVIVRLVRAKLKAVKIISHPDFKRVAAQSGHRMHLRSVQRLCRDLKSKDPKTKSMMANQRRVRIPAYQGDPNWLHRIVRPNQVWQVDENWADVLLASPEAYAVLPRIHLLWVIDVFTRCILAWRVCLETPGSHDYRKLLAMAFADKSAIVRDLGCANDFPCHGVPELILGDRGVIFTDTRVRRDLNRVGIEAQHAAAFQPQMKPIIERVLKTINNDFIDLIPGATLSGKDRRHLPTVIAEARNYGLTPEQFAHAIGQHVIDSYHQTPHQSLKYRTPIQAWEEGVRVHGIQAWPSGTAGATRLRLFQMEPVDNTIRKLGSMGYHFLDALHRPLGNAPLHGMPYIDRDDVRRSVVTYVDGPDAGKVACELSCTELEHDLEPVSAAELHARRNPKGATGWLSEREAVVNQIRDRIARGQSVRPKQALALEKERSKKASAAVKPRQVEPDIDLDLDLDERPAYGAL